MLNLLVLAASVASPNAVYPAQEVLGAFEDACGELVAPTLAASRIEAKGWSKIEIIGPNTESAGIVRAMNAGIRPPNGTISDQQFFTRMAAGRPLFLIYYRQSGTNLSNNCSIFDFNSDLRLTQDQVEKWMRRTPRSHLVGANGLWELEWIPGRTNSQSSVTVSYYPSSFGEIRRGIQFIATDNPGLRAAIFKKKTKH